MTMLYFVSLPISLILLKIKKAAPILFEAAPKLNYFFWGLFPNQTLWFRSIIPYSLASIRFQSNNHESGIFLNLPQKAA